MNAERTLMFATQAGNGEKLVNDALALFALAGVSVFIIFIVVSILLTLCIESFKWFIDILNDKNKSKKRKNNEK